MDRYFAPLISVICMKLKWTEQIDSAYSFIDALCSPPKNLLLWLYAKYVYTSTKLSTGMLHWKRKEEFLHKFLLFVVVLPPGISSTYTEQIANKRDLHVLKWII